MGERRALAVVLAAAGVLGGAAPAPGQIQPSDADLAVALSSNLNHPHAHHQVYFTVTVRNLGPDSQTGATVTFSVQNGLVKPKLIAASLDSGFGPPSCHAGHGALTCTYSSYQLAPPPNSNPIRLTIGATTGIRRRETAVATVGGSSDPNSANNRASKTLILRSTSH